MRLLVNDLGRPQDALQVGQQLLKTSLSDEDPLLHSHVLMLMGLAELLLANSSATRELRMGQEQKAVDLLLR